MTLLDGILAASLVQNIATDFLVNFAKNKCGSTNYFARVCIRCRNIPKVTMKIREVLSCPVGATVRGKSAPKLLPCALCPLAAFGQWVKLWVKTAWIFIQTQ